MSTVEIFYLLERMGALIRSEQRRKCAAIGLQPVHLQALDYLSRCNRFSDTPVAITSYLGTTKGTVSQTLLLLEKRGYVKKVRDTLDKRKVHLYLLSAGKETLDLAKPIELFNRASLILDQNDHETHKEGFVNALTALQKANKSESFGLCKTCYYFTTTSEGFRCRLTKEMLSKSDSEKICKEHTFTV